MMADIYQAFRGFLLTDPSGYDELPSDEKARRSAARAAIVAAVGAHIWPLKLPQGATTPAITITKVSAIRANILHGPASAARPRYQIDCWVREASGVSAYMTAQELGAAVRNRLEAYSGIMTDASTSPVSDYDTGVTFDDERDFFDPDVTGGYWRHSADYFLWYGVHPVSA